MKIDIMNTYQINQGSPVAYQKSRQFFRYNLLPLFSLVFFIILLILLLVFIYGRVAINVPGRATSIGALSLANSYIFASPLSSCADGTSLVRVTVFLLTNEGLGMSGQEVSLVVPGGLAVSTVQGVTDSIGKAYFDIASFNPGTYTIGASVNSNSLPQTVNIGFLDDASCPVQ